MISRKLGLTPVIVALFGVAASPAIAANPRVIVSDTTTTVCAQAVSTTTCQDPSFEACPVAQDPVKGCGPVITALYNTQYTATKAPVNTKSVLLPQAMLTQTAPSAPLGTVYNDALGFTATSGTVTSTGTGAILGDSVLTASAFYRLNPLTTPRFAYGNQTMSSCAEYAWKKWGTYSYFFDVASSLGTNYDAIVGAASTPGGYDIASNPVRWDGQSVTVNGIPLPSQGFQRNIFFDVGVARSADSPYAAQINAIIAAINTSNSNYPSSIPYITSSDDFGFSTRTLAAHRAAGITDAHYAAAIPRMQAYNALVNHYLDVMGELAEIPPLGGNGTNQPQIVPTHLLTSINSATHRLDNVAPEHIARMSKVIDAIHAAPKAQTVITVPPGGCGPNGSICLRKTLTADLTATEEAMSQMLIAEWNFDANHGCLGTSFNGQALQANYCDWSPEIFADRYESFEAWTDMSYQRCIQDTGDDFSLMNGSNAADQALQAKVWRDPQFIGRTYNDNLTHIDNQNGADRLGNPIKIDFFDAYEGRAEINAAEGAYQSAEIAQYNQVTSDLPLTGPAASPTAIGQSIQDSNEIGGDWFGGGYAYTAGWTMTPHSQTEYGQKPVAGQVPQICRIDGQVHGTLQAHAQILKQTISLLDTGLAAHTSPGHVTLDDAHLTIFGNDVFSDSGDYTGKSFNVPVDSTPASPSFSIIIPILCIPVEVGAGASLHIGVDTALTATAPPTCDINNLAVSISGSVTPNLSVDASAWAGIDLVLVSAGIEGTVNLITVQVPINTSVGLASDPGGLALAVDSQADLTLSELSGHVDLYAEVDLGFWSDRADLQLFSWSGFNQDVNLFSRHKHYPIASLNYVFFNQVAP